MNHKIKLWIGKYLNEQLDFRAQIFNTLGFLGCALGLIFGVISIVNYAGIGGIIANFGTSAAAACIILYANRTGTFRPFFLATVILVFFFIFPVLFFTGGGYRGGMPCFFVFAIVFTAIMLDGARRIIFTLLEFALYFACFLIAVLYPEAVRGFPTEEAVALDIITGCFACSAVLAIAIIRHTVIYDKKQKQLENANKRLSELDRMKTEFLQDMRHEMQNPLTTIARGIEFAENLMDRPDKSELARDALKLAQEESLRVGRMVESMINLATMSGGTENREKVDFESLLVNCAETFRLQLDNRENSLTVEVGPGLPYVYGVADQLKQVLINLFQNTAKHTRNGAVTLQASSDDTAITVSVSDTGEGIAPDVLARVFERGFSGEDSSGYGLAICRTIVEAHGGTIRVESGGERVESDKTSRPSALHSPPVTAGTAVTFTIPVYGGQSETRGKSE